MEREQADSRTCLGVPSREKRGGLGLPGGEPNPPHGAQGTRIRLPPREAQLARGTWPGGNGDMLPLLEGLCSERFYGLLIVMLPFNSGCHSMSAKPDRLGFMPPNYGTQAVQR